MDFVSTFHTDSYSSISPTRPELSQSGKTVFITGGGSGVGLAISKAFIAAGAARLIIVGRRAQVLEEVKEQLTQLSNSKTDIITYPCDIVDSARVTQVWEDMKAKSISVDVLVLNATVAGTTPQGMAEEDVVGKVRYTFELNVMAALQLTNLFLKQGPAKGKSIVSLNASAAHISPIQKVHIGYAASKTALGMLMQGIADSVDPAVTQIVSYHPGSIKTEAVMKSKWANAPIVWNTDTLPGDYAVWATSEDAKFLHGRFVWCNWDVEELKAKEEFAHPGFCRVGLQGPAAVSEQDLYVQMGAYLKKNAPK